MKHFFSLLLFTAVLLPWNAADAYVTTDQHAFSVTGTSGIYAIEFEFGHGDHDIHIPVFARESSEKAREYLSYSLIDSDETAITEIRSAGIVLGNTPIQNGHYVVPKGEKHTFTLLIIASAEKNMSTSEVSAQVNYLPFSFDGTEALQLNPSELQYYRTPSLMMPIRVQVSNITVSPVDQ